MSQHDESSVAFIGGGNMAGAIIGGLLRAARPAAKLMVVEPVAEQRERLHAQYGITALAGADERLRGAATVLWAVKPQSFLEAARPCAPFVGAALQISVMAGIPSAAIMRESGSAAVVRAMPNTPALIGQGIAGLYATSQVSAHQRAEVERLLAPTGRLLWLAEEAALDAVTAISGSGPAYVFYVVEAMIEAAQRMGLSAEDGRTLALATVAGSAELASRSSDPPAVLRARVTSKGGTTHAAISSLDADGVREAFIRALLAAQRRAAELGAEYA